jgi:hypothetical protein
MAQRRVVGFVCLVVVGGAVSTGCATTVTGGEGSSQDPPAITPPGGGDGGAGGEDGVDDGCDAESGEGCVVSGCRLPFPPPATVPCEVAETATRYYVDAANGSDANAGVTPSAPWATLSHAVQNAAAGGTIRVAAGGYGSSSILVDKALIIKGGYDPTFTVWDPDVHHSTFTGAVDVHHDDAVWAGFRMITNVAAGGPTPWTQHFHTVWAGSLVRNVIGIVFTGSDGDHLLSGDRHPDGGGPHHAHPLQRHLHDHQGPAALVRHRARPGASSRGPPSSTPIASASTRRTRAIPTPPTSSPDTGRAWIRRTRTRTSPTTSSRTSTRTSGRTASSSTAAATPSMSNNQMDIAVANNTILVHSERRERLFRERRRLRRHLARREQHRGRPRRRRDPRHRRQLRRRPVDRPRGEHRQPRVRLQRQLGVSPARDHLRRRHLRAPGLSPRCSPTRTAETSTCSRAAPAPARAPTCTDCPSTAASPRTSARRPGPPPAPGIAAPSSSRVRPTRSPAPGLTVC